jgi:predicted lactoylglutathione lyase
MIPYIEMDSTVEFILYVKDQKHSTTFYRALLQKDPRLEVPGMTEFIISENIILGLMPEKGIAQILTGMPHPETGNGIPRCELYLFVDDPSEHYKRGIEAGAKGISDAQARNWGHNVSYIADPDGHIIAFAKK